MFFSCANWSLLLGANLIVDVSLLLSMNRKKHSNISALVSLRAIFSSYITRITVAESLCFLSKMIAVWWDWIVVSRETIAELRECVTVWWK
jgi:hypothetical protein